MHHLLIGMILQAATLFLQPYVEAFALAWA